MRGNTRKYPGRRRGKAKEKRVTFNDSMDDNDDVVVWRPIRYAMASNSRVLVVDDYREAADALQMLLTADGFECRALDDPFAVCEMACEWQPFAVVLDIKMPRLDGLELARRLRAHPLTSHMLLIACTAAASREDRARARAVGFDAHCAKPLTPARLLRVLESAAAVHVVGDASRG
jgi:two-component system OmpR family response regulator